MVKVNLLSKKRQSKKNKSIVVYAGLGAFGLFALYFVVQLSIVVFGLISVNQKISKAKKDTESVSAQILKDNDNLNRFILSKFILSEVLKQRAKQFDYITYLSKISAMVPIGSELSGIDFQTKGFAMVKILSEDSNSYKTMEAAFKNMDLSDKFFTGSIIKQVSRMDNGNIMTDLIIGLGKQDAGK